MTTAEAFAILGALGTVVGIISTVVAYKKGLAKDSAENGKLSGVMMSDIGYIKASTDEIKAEQKEQRRVNTEVISRLTAVEQSAKQAHHRLDKIENNN